MKNRPDVLPNAAGFTLVEAIIVIAITGIVAAVVAVFIRGPMQGYVDTTRRAALTDIADTAVRRLSRDVRLALPNSVRVTVSGGTYYLEYLEAYAGGRYRADVDSAGNGDILDFTRPDTSFDLLGQTLTVTASGALIAVMNLGIPGADAYAGDTTSAYAGPVGTPVSNISIAAKQYPFASPTHRFFVVSGPVTYACAPASSGGDGTGTLTRYWGYPIQTAQPTSFGSGANALLATRVSGCQIDYTPAVTGRDGLVTLYLQLTQQGESVNLYEEIHVSNAP